MLTRPTYDNCIVAVNKTAVVMTGGVGQESQVVMLDLKDKRYFAMAPLKQPRRKVSKQHGCQMAIARFLDRFCLARRASGLWLRYAALQNLIPSFPWIAPGYQILQRRVADT